MVLGRAHNVVPPEKRKELSRVPSHEIVSHHVHKLGQVPMLLQFLGHFFYLLLYMVGVGRDDPHHLRVSSQ